MSTVRKPRACFTIAQDVEALRAIVDSEHGLFARGSVGPKLQQWNDVAQRVSTGGVEISGEVLRRHVGDLAKKLKAQESKDSQRMRWGLPWPKSDDELERDRLIQVYLQKTNESKAASSATPTRRVALTQSQSVIVKVTSPSRTQQTTRNCPQLPKPVQVLPVEVEEVSGGKRSQADVVVRENHDDLAPPPLSSPKTVRCSSDCSERLDLKRRRLEMEERMQNRMLDIQSEQIALQREQLRLQSESMRSMAESTQAIARALQALGRS